MRNVLTPWLAILCGTGLGVAAYAVTPEPPLEQFRNIPQRNVFGLKSGEAEPQTATPRTPPPKLTLTGITTLLGNKLALMRAAIPAAPGAPAQEKPLMLSEGQREGSIEVLAIDPKAGSVRVNDAGEVMTLTFAKNGVKPPTTTAAVGTQQTNAAAPSYNPFANTRMRAFPTRIPRTPPTGAAPEASAVGTPGANPYTGVATNPATATVPATTPSAADAALTPTGREPTPNQVTNSNQLSPETLLLLQAMQQEANNNNNNDNANSPPPPPQGVHTPFLNLPPGANLQRANPPLMPQ
jgi:hypothetical protein